MMLVASFGRETEHSVTEPRTKEALNSTSGDELGFAFGFRWMIRRGRLLISVSLLAAIVAAIVVILLPSRYESAAVILPENRNPMRLPAALGGLAGQFGIGLPTEA